VAELYLWVPIHWDSGHWPVGCLRIFEGFSPARRIKVGGDVPPQIIKSAVLTATTKTKRMKNLNKILLAATVAVAFTSVNRALAGEAFLSPRAQANQIRTVTGSSMGDPDLTKDRANGNAQAAALARDFRRVPGSNGDINHVGGNYAGAAAKNPLLSSNM
jgi:hypothetical protein